MTGGAAARRLLPAYFADYWAREDEFAPFAAAVSGPISPDVPTVGLWFAMTRIE